MEQLNDLPKDVADELARFVEAVQKAWGTDLVSIVLFGSAAEGRLRPTSDVNLLLILRTFTRAQMDQIREPFRFARAAIKLGVMFLLESELEEAAKAFAVKFNDIRQRHRILHGRDPFEKFEVSRETTILRLRQVLLNLSLRMRERYAAQGLREEQLALAIADMAGPIRSCAATICQLEGRTVSSPKEALETLVAGMAESRYTTILPLITEARVEGMLDSGVAGDTFITLMDLVGSLKTMAAKLS